MLALIVTFIFSFSLNIFASFLSLENLPEDEVLPPPIYLQQAEALEAYSVLSSTFNVDSDGYVTYPNNYAGAWIEDNKLYVALTESDNTFSIASAKNENFHSLLSDYSCVVYVSHNFSLNELNRIRYGIFDDLEKEYSITSHSIDVINNKINLGLLNLNSKTQQNILSAISLSVSSNTSTTYSNIITQKNPSSYSLFNASDLFNIRESELITPEVNIYGGMSVTRGTTGLPRSIGVCGTFTVNGTTYDGFVTAGHFLATSGTDQILRRNNSELGRVSLLMWQNNGNGDWACVRLTTDDTITNRIYGSSSSFVRQITGTLDDLPVGAAVMKYGQESGYAEAIISEQDVMETDREENRIHGLTRATLTSGTSDGGDSGGPYYTQSASGGNSYNFVGVHWGSNVSNGGDDIWFTPYIRFRNHFTVKTD